MTLTSKQSKFTPKGLESPAPLTAGVQKVPGGGGCVTSASEPPPPSRRRGNRSRARANCDDDGMCPPGRRRLAKDFTAAQTRTSFGSCQERKVFPLFYAPDRLGNEYVPIKGDPIRGPGTYNHAERNSILYHLAHKPESIKGYTMGARTSPRFALSDKHVAPGPTAYQTIWLKDQKIQPKYAAFSSKLPRFSQNVLEVELFPGPGTYDPYKTSHRHVTWPGKFGSPDWTLVPSPAKRTLRTELITDKAFRKQRNLLAYLSLYYSE